MPQVPLPRVGLSAGQTPAYGAPAVTPQKDFSGQQIQETGAALQKAGHVAMQIVEMERNEQDLASTKKAYARFSERVSQLVDGDYLLKQGEAAVGGSSGDDVTEGVKLSKTLDEELRKFADELPTEVSKGMFSEAGNKLLTSARMRINTHQSKQRKVWLAGETSAMMKSAVQASIDAYMAGEEDDLMADLMGSVPEGQRKSAWKMQLDTAVDQARELASMTGIGSEATDRMVEGVKTEIYDGIVTRMLDEDRVSEAKEFLKDHGKDMNPLVARQRRNSIKDLQEADRNAALGEKILRDLKKESEPGEDPPPVKGEEEFYGEERWGLVELDAISPVQGPPEAPVETDPLRPGGPPVSESNTMRSALGELRRRFNLPEGDPNKIDYKAFSAAWSHIRLVHSAEKEAQAADITEYLLEVEQFQENNPGVSVDSPGFPRHLRDRGIALGRLDDARIMHSRIPATPEARREQAADFLRALGEVDAGHFKDMSYQTLAARYYGRLGKDQWTWIKSLHKEAQSSDGSKSYTSTSKRKMKTAFSFKFITDISDQGNEKPKNLVEADRLRRFGNAVDAALEHAQMIKKRPLTADEEQDVMNDVGMNAVSTDFAFSTDLIRFSKDEIIRGQDEGDENTYYTSVGGQNVSLQELESLNNYPKIQGEMADGIRLAKAGDKADEIKKEIEELNEESVDPKIRRAKIEDMWGRRGFSYPTKPEMAEQYLYWRKEKKTAKEVEAHLEMRRGASIRPQEFPPLPFSFRR